jgi:hypothetical protein
VLFNIALTLNISVATESHPAELRKVSLYVPGKLYDTPFHEYGNCAGHTVTEVVLFNTALTLNISVATESQPAELRSVSLYVPGKLYDPPFHEYGSCAGQTLTLVVLVVAALTVKFSVAIESQPAELRSVSL